MNLAPLSSYLHPAQPFWSGQLRIIAPQIPSFWHSWMYDQGSLTTRLSALRPGEFRVAVRRQYYGRPSPLEQRELKLAFSQRIWCREVTLYLGEHAVVYARTAVPLTSLRGKGRRLQHLGNQSLGRFLFQQPNLKRSPLKVSRCQFNWAKQHDVTWCRRSVFSLGHQSLMVSEAFSNHLVRMSSCPQSE